MQNKSIKKVHYEHCIQWRKVQQEDLHCDSPLGTLSPSKFDLHNKDLIALISGSGGRINQFSKKNKNCIVLTVAEINCTYMKE